MMRFFAAFAFLAGCDPPPSSGLCNDKAICIADTLILPPECDPLLQTGCVAGEKCTWVVESDQGPTYPGHFGCALAGVRAPSETCTYARVDDGLYDNCAGGSICDTFRDGTCRSICNLNNGAPACAAGTPCVARVELFRDPRASSVGLCEL